MGLRFGDFISPGSLPKDSEENLCQTILLPHPTSYRKLFLRFNDTDDIIEKDVLERIKSDYEKYHLHDLKAYEYLFDLNKTCCPKCNSKI